MLFRSDSPLHPTVTQFESISPLNSPINALILSHIFASLLSSYYFAPSSEEIESQNILSSLLAEKTQVSLVISLR